MTNPKPESAATANQATAVKKSTVTSRRSSSESEEKSSVSQSSHHGQGQLVERIASNLSETHSLINFEEGSEKELAILQRALTKLVMFDQQEKDFANLIGSYNDLTGCNIKGSSSVIFVGDKKAKVSMSSGGTVNPRTKDAIAKIETCIENLKNERPTTL